MLYFCLVLHLATACNPFKGNRRRSIFADVREKEKDARIVTRVHIEDPSSQCNYRPKEKLVQDYPGILRSNSKESLLQSRGQFNALNTDEDIRSSRHGRLERFTSSQKVEKKKVQFKSQVLMHIYVSQCVAEYFRSKEFEYHKD